MKVAVTARGESLDDQVDERFGRAAAFLLVDTECRTVEKIDNQQNLNAVQGAGIQAAQSVWKAGAEAVVTGHCGPKAFNTLKTAGIDVYVGASGTVKEAVEAMKAGKLQRAEGADVGGHW